MQTHTDALKLHKLIHPSYHTQEVEPKKALTQQLQAEYKDRLNKNPGQKKAVLNTCSEIRVCLRAANRKNEAGLD